MIESAVVQRFFRIDLTDKDSRNAYYLVVEIFWASIMAAAASFNSAYAIRLGAENVQVGLLSSLPALFAILVSIPAGHIIQSRSRRKPWILASLAINRTGYLLIALLPFIKWTGIAQGDLVVWVLVLFSIPVHFFNVGFIPMLAEITSEEKRTAIFSARNIIYNASISVCTFLFGFWLSHIEFPINYQMMYGIGFITSCLSTYVLLKVDVSDIAITQGATNLKSALKELSLTFTEAFTKYPRFISITRNTLFHGMGLWIAAPLYTIYYVKSLNADDGWLGLQGTVLSAATILGYAIWRRLIRRWGEPITLKRTIVCAGLFPILAGLLPSLSLILFAIALNGLIAPGINLSHFNTLLKVTPESNRPGYTALYMTIMNIGAFVGPLIGIALAGIIGVGQTLIVCGFLSILGSTSFWIWPIKAFETSA